MYYNTFVKVLNLNFFYQLLKQQLHSEPIMETMTHYYCKKLGSMNMSVNQKQDKCKDLFRKFNSSFVF